MGDAVHYVARPIWSLNSHLIVRNLMPTLVVKGGCYGSWPALRAHVNLTLASASANGRVISILFIPPCAPLCCISTSNLTWFAAQVTELLLRYRAYVN